MGGEEDRTAVVAILSKDSSELLLDQRVEAACGLVEKVEGYIGLERPDDGHLLTIAGREGFDPA